MRLALLPSLIMTLGVLAAAPPALAQPASQSPGCCTATTRDVEKVGGNLGNQNYSALRQINKANVKQLGAIWLNEIEGGITTGTNQSTTIVKDGVIYIESALGKLHAVDGVTGQTKWVYPGKGTITRRGPAIGQGMVYTIATGNTVVALNKDTGQVVWEKQINGYGNVAKVGVVYHDGMLYLGTNDGTRGAALAVDAGTGDLKWYFFGIPGPGEFGYDTWGGGPQSGATPWIHPAVDPELNLVYWTFGNARGGSSQDGSQRPGQNLFANSIVATDAKTGAYKWHFQSVHHDIWDMDNVNAPVLADVTVKGKPRKAVIYGSKTAMWYILDRTDGTPLIGIDEKPVPQDARQNTWPTQPYPRGDAWMPLCVTDSGPARAVPNFKRGCLYSAHWDEPVLSIPGQGGGGDWSHVSFSHSTKLVYTGFGYVSSAHSLTEASNGLRPLGTEMTGGIVAIDPATNKIRWKKDMPYSLAHGNGILTTASDLMFIGQPDGNLLGMDALNGRELWRFQTGAAISASPITYEVNGEQYMAIYAGGTGIPYGDSAQRGDHLWAFKIGGTVPQAAEPTKPVIRRPINAAAVEGSVVNNTVTLARQWSGGQVGAAEAGGTNAMAPQHLRVPVGTTVTFHNPATNAKPHCATQFFEGLFNAGPLAPGQSFQYTFSERGEYFYNDCTDPRSTGKVVVY
jgi:PQQ-dependent dehydrogenase (methanol/ethanol family)